MKKLYTRYMSDYLSDRLVGALVLAVVLFGALAVSGGPGEPSISAEAAAAQSTPGGVGPYYTRDAY